MRIATSAAAARRAGAVCIALLAAGTAHAQAYPVRDGFQWVTAGAIAVPSGDWHWPSISDDGRYVVATSRGIFPTAVRFDRTAPSLTYAVVAPDCDNPPCKAYDPRISGDGRYVVFASDSTYNLEVPDSQFDIFRWDSQTGATRRVSVPPNNGAQNGHASVPDVSRDGRYVSFVSQATNLVVGGTIGGSKAFVADMTATPPTMLAASPPYNTVESARLSSNGRYLAFRADNQVLLRDTQAGAPVFFGWVGASGLLSPAMTSLAISPDGRYASQAAFANGEFRTYVFDRMTPSIRIVGESSDHEGSTAASSGAGFVTLTRCNFTNVYSAQIAVQSRSGSLALLGLADGPFESCDTGIDITPRGDRIAVSLPRLVQPALNVPDQQHVFVVDNPLYQPLPANVAQYQGGIPANSANVQSSANGRLVVFQSDLPAEQLLCFDADLQLYTPGCAPADTNGQPDVFRYDRSSNSIELVSSVDGQTAVGGRNPAIDTRGEKIVFEAIDSGFVASPNAGKHADRIAQSSTYGIFLASLLAGTSQRVMQRMSTARNGALANGHSQKPAISGNGRIVAFSTDASNINPGSDGNGMRDIVAVDTATGTVRCVSSCPGAIADGPSDHPSVSNNGLVAFETRAASLIGGINGKGSAFEQIMLFDLQRQILRLLSRAPSGLPANGASQRPRIGTYGTTIVFQTNASDLASGDGNGRIDVYLLNLLTGAGQRISRVPPPGGKANPYAPKTTGATEDGDSTQPTLSGDGRFVAFQTTATNLVDSDTNGVSDLIVADLRNGTLQRIAQGFGGTESNGASETPHLNHNGLQLGFHSFATNLDEIGDPDPATSEPYVRDNPGARSVVFADAFE